MNTAVSDSNTLQFQVKDETASESRLSRRRELKFAVRGADVSKLRRAFLGSCRRMTHKFAVSTVRSLYLDSADLRACRKHIDGVGRRQKVRLRWYDSQLPADDLFFEIKWRDNRVTGKHRVHLGLSGSIAQRPFAEILEALHGTLPSTYRSALLAFDEPVMLVEYKREHFRARSGGARLTLDYNIRYFSQINRSRLCTLFPQPLHDLVVVEGKVPVGYERTLRSTLYPFKARPGRCSKYINGCQLLGLIPRLAV